MVQLVDRFVLAIVISLAVLSALTPDWQEDPKTGWVQVCAMAGGLVVLGIYMILR